jgi:SARP family transcriptional regulator, regulator of embCAB operon
MALIAPGLGTEVTVGVALLGGFHLRGSGRPLSGVPRTSQRLLAFLALHDHVVNRAAIAGTLWPEASERHAYANLRAALVRLERACRGVLQAGRLELRLAEGVSVDVGHARALAWRLLDPGAELRPSDHSPDALACLSADLLPGWYDDWVLSEGEDWRQLRLHALEALADRLTAIGRWGEAADAAGAAVRAEPLRESANGALIRVHLAEGNQSEAVRQFDRYRSLLGAELGLEPTPRLRRLVRDLQAGSR